MSRDFEKPVDQPVEVKRRKLTEGPELSRSKHTQEQEFLPKPSALKKKVAKPKKAKKPPAPPKKRPDEACDNCGYMACRCEA